MRRIGVTNVDCLPRISTVVLILMVMALSLVIILRMGAGDKKVTETYFERKVESKMDLVYEQVYMIEATYYAKEAVKSRAAEQARIRFVRSLNLPTPEEQEVIAAATAKAQILAATDMKVTTKAKAKPMVEEKHYSEDIYIIGAKMLNGEAGGISSMTERSACLWIACNRVLDERYPDTLEEVITQKSQFNGYRKNQKYTDADYELAVDVFERFYREQNGETAEEVGRSLPKDYLYFWGDGKHNHFTKVQNGKSYVFGSTLDSPYEN